MEFYIPSLSHYNIWIDIHINANILLQAYTDKMNQTLFLNCKLFDRLLHSIMYVCNCSIQGFLAAKHGMLFDKLTIQGF